MLQALTVKGSFKGISGHDRHVREFVRKLNARGIKIHLHDFGWWAPSKLPEDKSNDWYETLSQPVDSRVMLHFCMPHQVEADENKFNVNFTMFEATRVLRHWVKCNLRHDLVILPTAACKQTWIDSGFPAERIRLCPLAVNSERFSPDAKPMAHTDDRGKSIDEFAVRFLNISDVMPRKNLLGLLRVWLQATNRSDDAVLILKINCGSELWLNKFMQSIAQLEAKLGKSRKESAPVIFLLNQFFSDEDMPGLFRAATHYWSMSHGEGWDLPMMEAAATGLHVIAPNHTAYTTYLDESVARLIPVKTVPAKFKWSDDTHTLFKGAKWWTPDETVAAEYIRQAIENPPSDYNSALCARVQQEFTWTKATERLLDILTEVETFERRAGSKQKLFDFSRFKFFGLDNS